MTPPLALEARAFYTQPNLCTIHLLFPSIPPPASAALWFSTPSIATGDIPLGVHHRCLPNLDSGLFRGVCVDAPMQAMRREKTGMTWHGAVEVVRAWMDHERRKSIEWRNTPGP